MPPFFMILLNYFRTRPLEKVILSLKIWVLLKVCCDCINIVFTWYSSSCNQLSTIKFGILIWHLNIILIFKKMVEFFNSYGIIHSFVKIIYLWNHSFIHLSFIWVSVVHAVFGRFFNHISVFHISSVLDLTSTLNWFRSESLKLQHGGFVFFDEMMRQTHIGK